MRYSKRAVSLIKEFEGFRAYSYNDVGNKAIGYGTTINSSNEHLINEPISEKQAEQLLLSYCDYVLSQIDKVLEVNINQNQIDALVSFGYNLGPAVALKIVRDINAQKTDQEVTERMLKYVYADSQKLDHLVWRRKKEVELFLKPYYSPFILITALLLLYALVK